MKRRLAIALVLPLVLAGCSGTGTRGTVYVTSTQIVEPDGSVSDGGGSEPAASADWQKEYAWVLDHPGDYPVNSAAQYTPDGQYSYALVEANGGGSPELLLAVSGGHTQPIIVFTIGDDGKAHASPEVLIAGTPGNGAAREAVWASASGRGIYQISGSSGRPERQSRLFTLSGASLVPSGEETFDIRYPLPDHLAIDFRPVADRRGLEDGALTVRKIDDMAAQGGAPASQDANPSNGGSAESQGMYPNQMEFTGTVRMYTGAELQGDKGMPNGEDPNTEYFVLEMDSPQQVRGRIAGEHTTREVKQFKLGERAPGQGMAIEWDQHVGKRVRITAPGDAISYPSDTRMPLGMPGFGSTFNYKVL